jgi:hypothetical protein
MLSFFLSELAKVLFEMQLKTTIWPNYRLGFIWHPLHLNKIVFLLPAEKIYTILTGYLGKRVAN